MSTTSATSDSHNCTTCPQHAACGRQEQKAPGSSPPSAMDMVKIALGLAFACAISALILGWVYMKTEPVKEKNLKAREETMIRALLGLDEGAKIFEIRRYLSMKDGRAEIGYLTPRFLIEFSDTGEKIGLNELPENLQKPSATEDEKDRFALEKMHRPDRPDARYIGRFFVGKKDGKLAGYIVEGSTLGFKNQIRFFLALESDMTVRGVEVVEHEEDPGLGAEIIQKYFKNQFVGRSSDTISHLEVVREPLPPDWRKALEAIGEIPADEWIGLHEADLAKHPNIYAITGSTISSTAVTNGVKRTMQNFQRRLALLAPYMKEALP